MNNLKTIGRWIAVLPSWIAGLLVAPFVVNTFFAFQAWFIGGNSDGGWYKITYYIVSSFIGGLWGIHWATKVAPGYKKIVSIIFFAITVVLSVLWAFAITFYPDPETATFWSYLGAISMVTGAGYITYQIFEKGEEYEPFE